MKLRELSYISNILSITRLMLAIPIYYLVRLQTTTGNYLAVLVMILAALTDAYDGRLARRLKQKSDLGRVLDPVADKICIVLVALILVKTRDLPMWFLILIIGRDLAILILGLVLVVRTKVVVESNMLGKVTVTSLAVTIIAFTLELDPVKLFFLWCSVALILASSLSYLWKLIEMSRSNKKFA